MSLTTYVNTDSAERVWPSLSAPDGSTLSLEAGESVELDLPDGFADPYLKPKPAATPVQTAPKPPLTPTPPASISTSSSQEASK